MPPVGDPLLTKGPRGLMLTPRGRQIVVPLRRGLAELERAMTGESAFDPATSRRAFTVVAGDFFALQFLPALLAIVGKEAPGVDLIVRPPDARMDVSRLEAGESDVIVSVNRPESAVLRSRKMYVECFVCVVRSGHPEISEPLPREKVAQRLPRRPKRHQGAELCDERLRRYSSSGLVVVGVAS